MNTGNVYLLPMLLHEDGWEALPADTKKWIMQCDAFFVENEKTTRRFFKKVWNKPLREASLPAGPQKHAFCLTDHRPCSPFGADLIATDQGGLRAPMTTQSTQILLRP